MYWDHMTGWGWAYMLFLSITWVVAVVVVTWAVVTVLRSGASSPDRGDARAAREILDERLAKGELDLEEYRNLRAAIDDPVSSGKRVPQG
jgi:putative membrane protein